MLLSVCCNASLQKEPVPLDMRGTTPPAFQAFKKRVKENDRKKQQVQLLPVRRKLLAFSSEGQARGQVRRREAPTRGVPGSAIQGTSSSHQAPNPINPPRRVFRRPKPKKMVEANPDEVEASHAYPAEALRKKGPC